MVVTVFQFLLPNELYLHFVHPPNKNVTETFIVIVFHVYIYLQG
jgi:hypothetical protein